MRQQLEVIDLPAPYTDQQSIEQITAHTRALVRNELPAFQVDVGTDLHLLGTLAVRSLIETEMNLHTGELHANNGHPPFAFTGQNMRAPYYVRSGHKKITRLAPHLDGEQIGPAVHKEYFGKPTKVQFGYLTSGKVLPLYDESVSYEGPDLEPFVETLYEGVTHVGRISIFSQGYTDISMKPTAHYFERDPNQQIGGRSTRYFMIDPHSYNLDGIADYGSFRIMRQHMSMHLDYQQWEILKNELAGGTSVDDQSSLHQLIDSHLKDHPGQNYTYWDIPGEIVTSYGVYPKGFPIDTEKFVVTRR
jgi:hypothetical protein